MPRQTDANVYLRVFHPASRVTESAVQVAILLSSLPSPVAGVTPVRRCSHPVGQDVSPRAHCVVRPATSLRRCNLTITRRSKNETTAQGREAPCSHPGALSR